MLIVKQLVVKLIVVLFSTITFINCCAQKTEKPHPTSKAPQLKILAGAERINVYLPYLKGKRVGVFANQTSVVGHTHLVDTLRKLGVDIKVIFGPEHGFRGTA